jgi:hypothetical protein
MSNGNVKIDASDFSKLGRAIHNLPDELKRNAFHSAGKRVATMARTQIVKRLAAYTGLKQKTIRSASSAYVTRDGEISVRISSKWIPLHKLPHRARKAGMFVHGRGTLHNAFTAKMSNGHVGIFNNTGGYNKKSKRLNAIRELYGPNPAHAVFTDRHGEFQKLALEIAEERYMQRLLHELDRRLDKLNR